MKSSFLRRFPLGGLALVTVIGAAGCQPGGAVGPASSAPTAPTASASTRSVDLQAHRGGRGETTEESRLAFEKALSLGVSTLELDIVLSADNVPVVWHDPTVLESKCRDTAPATAGDPQFPYVGKVLHDLTWAQLSTLDCDKQLSDFPSAEVAQHNKMLQLGDVFALAKQRHADVRFNVETKIEADHPEQSASPQQYVDVIVGEVHKAQLSNKVEIQSFDWRSLPLAHRADPALGIVALWDETTWLKGSAWIGDVDYDAVGGDVIRAAQQVDATILSPGYSVPYGGKVGDSGFAFVADRTFVERAHAAKLTVIPWTINDKDTMKAQLETGVDGIITDYPGVLRQVMAEQGMTLPTPYPAH